jgi:hypothetical protein
VPETRLTLADLLRRRRQAPGIDPPVTLRLIYQMLSELLS